MYPNTYGNQPRYKQLLFNKTEHGIHVRHIR